jgi:hypothetical protein
MKSKIKNLIFNTVVSASRGDAVSLQPHQVFRSKTRWGRSVLEWPSLDAFLATEKIQSGVHSVPIGEFAGKAVNYDFFLTARPGTVLLCHFHGNAPREKSELPIFTGLGVTSSIATSMFVPSDPVLALDASLSLGWHFGCEGIPLQSITVSIVKKLQESLHARRVVAWGGSGGGFAAIRVAKDTPNAIALVWNPQTDIAKYTQMFVDRYLRIAFPTIGFGGTFPSDRGRFPSLCTEEFAAGYQGKVLYLQESTDWHVDAHLKPFLANFCGKTCSSIVESSSFSGCVTDQLYLHLDHWGNGHIPPSKDSLTKILTLLTDVTINLENLDNLKCFPGKVVEDTAVNVSPSGTACQSSGKIGSHPLGSLPKDVTSMDFNEILSIRMDRIADDFLPFDVSVSCSGDTVALPLFTGEIVEVSLSHGVEWDRRFGAQHNSSVMHLFSLNLVGKLLSTFLKRNDGDALRVAVVMLQSFLSYSSVPGNQLRIGRIPSGDHSAANRVKALIKFIQVMRGREDMDSALVERVCGCLKYWSDWLVDPKNYKE